jgi:hypothetical protein
MMRHPDREMSQPLVRTLSVMVLTRAERHFEPATTVAARFAAGTGDPAGLPAVTPLKIEDVRTDTHDRRECQRGGWRPCRPCSRPTLATAIAGEPLIAASERVSSRGIEGCTDDA